MSLAVGLRFPGLFSNSLKFSQILSNSLKLLLVFLLMVGKGYSVIVPIEVPPDIPDSLLFDLQKLSKNPQVMERLRQISLKEIKKAFDKGVKDVQPILVRKGKPIEPPRDTFYKPDAFCVRKRLRTCIGGGWTGAEVSRINNHLSRIIPIIEDIYGQAFMTPRMLYTGNPYVKIIKDDNPPRGSGITCAPWYNAVCFVITGEFGCTLWPWDDNGYIVINPGGGIYDSEVDDALLTHELFHAFRLNWILTYPQYEEGHAEGGMILATKELCRIYGSGCGYVRHYYTKYTPYIFHQYYNLPLTGSNLRWTDFYVFGYERAWGIRYSTWGYLWIKAYLNNNSFFENFNDLLCSYSPGYFRTAGYGDYLNLLSSPAFGSGAIEGRDFTRWFKNQPAFGVLYPDSGNLSYVLGVLPISINVYQATLGIFYYKRTPFAEIPMPGDIYLKVWNSDGRLVKDSVITLDSTGFGSVTLFMSQIEQKRGRIKVEVCDKGKCWGNAEDPPIYAEIMLAFPFDTVKDIRGATGAEKGLNITVGPYNVMDTNGYFRSPDNFHQHSLSVSYYSQFLGSMITVLTKDSIPHWVYPGLYDTIPYNRRLKIPPAKPQNFTIYEFDSTTGRITLIWRKNAEADIKGYFVYKSSDYGPFYPNFTLDTVFIDTLGPCVTHRLFVVPRDIWGYLGEPTDTVEIFYDNGSFSCLFSNLSDNKDKAGNSFITVYDVSGKKVFEGSRDVFRKLKKIKGVYFIKNGKKITKEVMK